MNGRRFTIRKQGSGVRNILTGCLIGVLTLMLLLAVSSVIITKSNMNLSNAKYLCLISLLISAFIGAMCSAYKNRTMKGFITGILTSSVVSLLFLLFIVIINSGIVTTFALIMTVLSVIIGIPGGIIGANLKQ